MSLDPKPALRGLRKGADLLASIPEYVRNSKGYTPNAAAIAALKKADRKPVTVHVVFGSWCPHCRQHVPLMLRVENEVKNPNIKFEYYGIDNPPDGWKDPEVKRLGIKGIPTAIVYVNGRRPAASRARTGTPRGGLPRSINGPAREGEVASAASGSIPPLCQVASGDCSSPGAAKRESPKSASRGLQRPGLLPRQRRPLEPAPPGRQDLRQPGEIGQRMDPHRPQPRRRREAPDWDRRSPSPAATAARTARARASRLRGAGAGPPPRPAAAGGPGGQRRARSRELARRGARPAPRASPAV